MNVGRAFTMSWYAKRAAGTLANSVQHRHVHVRDSWGEGARGSHWQSTTSCSQQHSVHEHRNCENSFFSAAATYPTHPRVQFWRPEMPAVHTDGEDGAAATQLLRERVEDAVGRARRGIRRRDPVGCRRRLALVARESGHARDRARRRIRS